MPSSGSVLTLAYRRDRWCSSLDMPSSLERSCSCLRTVPANLSGDWVLAMLASLVSSIFGTYIPRLTVLSQVILFCDVRPLHTLGCPSYSGSLLRASHRE